MIFEFSFSQTQKLGIPHELEAFLPRCQRIGALRFSFRREQSLSLLDRSVGRVVGVARWIYKSSYPFRLFMS